MALAPYSKEGQKMGQQMKYKDRVAIEYQIDENPESGLRSVAEKLGVARSTILREIASNSTVMPSKSIPFCKGSKRPGDGGGCPTKGRWPFCCNRCAKTNCPKERLFYRADEADRLSKARNAKSARKPSKRTLERASVVEAAVSPLIKKGISIEAAARSSSCDVHPTTIRMWVDRNLISPDRTDLPRAAKFYCKRLYDYSRKRPGAPARVVYGRTIEDYEEWMSKGSHFAVQVDTVIGRSTDGHCVLTVMDPKTKLQIGMRIRKTAESVNKAIVAIHEAFSACGLAFDTILTDWIMIQALSLPAAFFHA